MPAISFSKVDFPDPFLPINASDEPGLISRFISSKTVKVFFSLFSEFLLLLVLSLKRNLDLSVEYVELPLPF